MKDDHSHPLGLAGVDGGGILSDDDVAIRSSGTPNALDRWLVGRLGYMAGKPPVTMALWDGSVGYQPDGESIGRIIFRDRGAIWSSLAHPELGFGDCYSAGRIAVEGDLIQVLFRVFQAVDQSGMQRFKRNFLGRLPRPKANTRAGSKDNVHHHYDLGNDFYRLWLDELMVYTCAYYPRPEATLEQAQFAKLDHVARKLGLQPGQTVVEAGCGWGALALHLAEHYGAEVTAYNISTEQISYARDEARRRGLDGKVTFIQDDYRNMKDQYDAFVSVGMLEHVGVEHYAELGGVVNRVLKPGGKGLIHSVGRSYPAAVNAWLEKRIFPGSYPPSLREMMGIFEPYRFSIMDIENLRLHYVQTLTEWLRRFDANEETIRSMYDGHFVRAWRLYLGGCAAAFLASSIQLFQVLFAHPTDNRLPNTRRYIYGEETPPRWNFD